MADVNRAPWAVESAWWCPCGIQVRMARTPPAYMDCPRCGRPMSLRVRELDETHPAYVPEPERKEN
jgi:hypothetical protein